MPLIAFIWNDATVPADSVMTVATQQWQQSCLQIWHMTIGRLKVVSDRYWYQTSDIGCNLNYRGWNGNCTPISDMDSGWTWGVQVKLGDPLRTSAIPELLRGVFTTRRCYTNTHLPYLTLPYLRQNQGPPTTMAVVRESFVGGQQDRTWARLTMWFPCWNHVGQQMCWSWNFYLLQSTNFDQRSTSAVHSSIQFFSLQLVCASVFPYKYQPVW